MNRRKLLLAGASIAALGACSSSRKIPDLPALKTSVGLRAQWSVNLDGGGAGFEPAAVLDSIYAADRDGELVRVRAGDGKLQWRIDIGVPLVAGVGAAAGLVAVAGRDGSLRLFDESGKPRWQAQLGAESTSVPVLDGDVVIVRSSDNRVQAFDALTGRRRWTYTRQNPSLVLRQTSRMVLDASTVYAGLPGGRLLALSTETGALRWETAISLPRGSNEIERLADVLGTPALSGREVCAGTFQGRIGCIDATSGRPLWNQRLAVDGGLAFDGRQVIATDEKGRVHAYSRAGESAWVQDALVGRALGAPVLAGARVLIGDEQGYLHLLSAEDGKLLGRMATDGSAALGAPVPVGPVFVVQTASGRLYGLTAG